jgi:hypothetical protein
MRKEALFHNADVQNRFGWKLAICQHPMYLLIDEDRGEPVVCERIPPWGAPDAEEYVERVRRNLQSIKKYPDLKINYEFSGVEVEAIAEKFPDVINDAKGLFEKGRLDFLNGTYAQPHLHIFGSESNWRQFEMGLEIYSRLFGKQIKTYQCQESGVHWQLPQLLCLFGYRFMTTPSFRWLMSIENGPLELTGDEVYGIEMYTRSSDNFVDAEGIDGTVIPAYIHSRSSYPDDRLYAIRRDLVRGRKIWIMNPDMMEVDDDLYKELNTTFTTTLLEDAFRETWLKDQPHNKVRLSTNWSYAEGVWAEELLRQNKRAEEQAVLAESLCCLASMAGFPVDYKETVKLIWHDILKYQHHDVHWTEVSDLRRKAIDKLEAGVRVSIELAGHAAAAFISKNPGGAVDRSERYISFFNVTSRWRRVPIELDAMAFSEAPEGFQRFGDRFIGEADLPAFSAKSFQISDGAEVSKKEQLPCNISTPAYEVEFSECGLIRRLFSRDKEILRPGEYLGGEIRCIAGDIWHTNRDAECTFFTGSVFDILERRYTIASVPGTERYFFYKTIPVIKAELEFEFDGNEIGNFWADYSKLNVYFPTSGGEIYHDIPFGYQKGLPDRPLYATNWIYSGGFVYVNRGTVKHWVRDGVLVNLLAWGSNQFDNRIHYGGENRYAAYDQKLRGRCSIEYYLIPYGTFDGNKICADVESLTFPVFASSGKANTTFHPHLDSKRMVTALHEKDGVVCARGYALPGRLSKRGFEIFDEPVLKSDKK